MKVTINVPDNATRIQYCEMDAQGYEVWKAVTLGDYVCMLKDGEPEDKSDG